MLYQLCLKDIKKASEIFGNNGFELIEKTLFSEGKIPFWGMVKYPDLKD